jgi:hypothetical protein
MDKGSGQLRQRSLADGLGISPEGSVIFAYRDSARGLEYLRRATDIHHHGLRFELRGFQYAALLDWRELRSSAEQPWDALCDALHGEGVYSVEEALMRLRLRPVHEALHQAINGNNVCSIAEVAGKETRKHAIEPPKEEPTNTIELPEKAEPAAQASEKLSTTTLDAGLRNFLANSQQFFERAIESLSREDRKELTSRIVGITKDEAAADAMLADLKQHFSKECEAWTSAAVRLPLLEQSFSTVWPASVRYILPSSEPGISIEQVWSPVLAWVILRSFSSQGIHAALFDKLYLRAALAETFSSLGIEGEGAWRAAARVRVLLSHAASTSEPLIESRTFWDDPDVRWLAGVNDASGATYFNKEQFEELLSWTQLPALMESALQSTDQTSSLKDIEAVVSKAYIAANDAEYKLHVYLNLLHNGKPLDKGKPTGFETPVTP